MVCRFSSCLWLCIFVGCGRTPPQTNEAPSQPPVLAIGAERSNRPALEVISGDGNLGSADFGEERSCSFTIRNNTQRDMMLEVGEKSCSCAGVRLETTILAAGKTTSLSLVWTPKVEALEAGTARLWAELIGSHGVSLPKPLRLEATGRLNPRVQVAFPRGPLEFGKLTPSDLANPARTLILEVYGNSSPVKLQSVQSTLSGLQVVEPSEPLTPDRLQTLRAVSGYRIAVKPTETLPHGEFQGNLQIKTDQRDHPLLIPFHGVFETSSIALSREQVTLPPRLNLKQGYRIPPITVTIRYGTCTNCELRSITPNFLQAKVIKQDAKTWRVEMQLPATAEEIKSKVSPEEWRHIETFGFETGEIILVLDHPDVKQISIPISGSLLQFE